MCGPRCHHVPLLLGARLLGVAHRLVPDSVVATNPAETDRANAIVWTSRTEKQRAQEHVKAKQSESISVRGPVHVNPMEVSRG